MIRSSRIKLVHLLLALFAFALVGKAAHVQLFQGRAWAENARRQQTARRDIPAPRGDIRDGVGRILVQSKETVRLEIAPREVRDRQKLRRLLQRAGVSREHLARATNPSVAWVTLPGRWLPTDVAELLTMRGVHPTVIVDRHYEVTPSERRFVGRVDANGTAIDGIERELDSLLKGTPGSAILLRDAKGRRFASPATRGTAPVAGNSVVLTINHALQEITERALSDAVAKLGADGGDIVVLDPHSGAVLAMASRRADPRSTAATALSEPFEPGSTLKPFVAAALLERGRVNPTETVDTYGGQMTLHGRTITDVHKGDRMTLREVIQYSSNVGIVQFASRLSPREQYEALRDFGFGVATGVPYPAEVPGRLPTPARWSKQSPASLAMGYELAVTPLQLAAGYAAFANGGELLAPALVKEIVAPDGKVLYRHQRRVVRRVLSKRAADEMRAMLVDVVAGGTALQADLSAFAVAGKTGTARRNIRGRYVAGQYYATFVGLFPAENPQYVILVKLDSPRGGSYYGGTTAAPVTKAVLEAAIAARDAALDRALLASARTEKPDTTSLTGTGDRATAIVLAGKPERTAPASSAVGSYVPAAGTTSLARPAAPPREDPRRPPPTSAFVFELPSAPERDTTQATGRTVPDVRGLELRDAVRALHEAGFRIQLARGSGGTSPAAGTVARPGSLVRLHVDR